MHEFFIEGKEIKHVEEILHDAMWAHEMKFFFFSFIFILSIMMMMKER